MLGPETSPVHLTPHPLAFQWNSAQSAVWKHILPIDGGQQDQLRDGTWCRERDRLKWTATVTRVQWTKPSLMLWKTTSEFHGGGFGGLGGECVQTARDITRGEVLPAHWRAVRTRRQWQHLPMQCGKPMSSFVSQSIGFVQTLSRQLKRSECLHASPVDSF